LSHYGIEENLEHGRVLAHQSNPQIFKVVLMIDNSNSEAIMEYCTQTKEWNLELTESNIICRIGENAYIFYERCKAYNFHSWARDFVTLKSAIKHNDRIYLLEKSV
jgi:hypothetical protein